MSAHRVLGEGGADTGGVTPDQVGLQAIEIAAAIGRWPVAESVLIP
jgi:hypothetical protein